LLFKFNINYEYFVLTFDLTDNQKDIKQLIKDLRI